MHLEDGPTASPLAWIARDASKRGRPERACWVLHAAPDWSRVHFDDERDVVVDYLLGALTDAIGVTLPSVRTAIAHRWAFALPIETLSDRCLFDADQSIGACGDWCAGPRVEGAFSSGSALAARIAARCEKSV